MSEKSELRTIGRAAALLRQENPRFCYGTDLEIAAFTMFLYMEMNDIALPSLVIDGPINIETLEEAYEKGWSAIIHDGKLLGFRKEKAL